MKSLPGWDIIIIGEVICCTNPILPRFDSGDSIKRDCWLTSKHGWSMLATLASSDWFTQLHIQTLAHLI